MLDCYLQGAQGPHGYPGTPGIPVSFLLAKITSSVKSIKLIKKARLFPLLILGSYSINNSLGIKLSVL